MASYLFLRQEPINTSSYEFTSELTVQGLYTVTATNTVVRNHRDLAGSILSLLNYKPSFYVYIQYKSKLYRIKGYDDAAYSSIIFKMLESDYINPFVSVMQVSNFDMQSIQLEPTHKCDGSVVIVDERVPIYRTATILGSLSNPCKYTVQHQPTVIYGGVKWHYKCQDGPSSSTIDVFLSIDQITIPSYARALTSHYQSTGIYKETYIITRLLYHTTAQTDLQACRSDPVAYMKDRLVEDWCRRPYFDSRVDEIQETDVPAGNVIHTAASVDVLCNGSVADAMARIDALSI